MTGFLTALVRQVLQTGQRLVIEPLEDLLR